MILADTSVWIDHLRNGRDDLTRRLSAGQVLCHPFVRGELSAGQIKDRTATLQFLAELPPAEVAGVLAREAIETTRGATGAAYTQGLDAFLGLARCVRLCIMAGVRVRQAAYPTLAVNRDDDIDLEERREDAADRRADRVRIDYDRERETEAENERDGFPMTPLGRAEALEAVLARHPHVDPDGRHGAKIIEIKHRLQRPDPPDPPAPAAPRNRAERRQAQRRLRRASG